MKAAELRAAMQKTRITPASFRVVDVPGWGTIGVRDLSVKEVDAQAADDAEAGPGEKTRLARAAARVIVDDDGKPIYDPKNAEDVALIEQQPWRMLRKIVLDEDEPKTEVSKGN